MNHAETFKVILLTAAAAASVQSCADVSADVSGASVAPLAAGAPVSDAACPEGTSPTPVGAETHCRLEGLIDSDVTLTAGPLYQIAGRVQIGLPGSPTQLGAGRTLRIDPGVRLYGADRDATLEIARGSRILAEGAPEAPIVFTSAWEVGAAEALGLPARVNPLAPRGEWGGLIVSGASDVMGAHGRAGTVCDAPDADAPAYCERLGVDAGSLYGGAAGAGDASGALRFVEIRFAGAVQEGPRGLQRLPALTLQGVGAATRVEDVTIVGAFGDGLRLLGGWVDVQRVRVLGAGDDGVDWSYGYRGALRQVVVAHDARLGDGDNGFEGSASDLPEEFDPPLAQAGAPAHPIRSHPELVDVTVIGDPAVSDSGILLRGGTSVRIAGATLAGGFARAGFDIDDAETYRQITPAHLSGMVVNTAGGPGLSTDFDDDRLARAFGENTLAPVERTLADALAAMTPAAAPTPEAPAPAAAATLAAETPAPLRVAPAVIGLRRAAAIELPALAEAWSLAPADGSIRLTQATSRFSSET